MSSISSPDLNPVRAVARLAALDPRRTVIRYEGGDLTIAQVDERAARLAAVLAGGGIGKGDRVAYLGTNSPTFLVTYLAAARLGAVFVPINFRLAAEEVGTILVRGGASAIVCEEGHRRMVDEVAPQTPVQLFLLVDDDPAVPVTGDAPPRWRRLAPELAAVALADGAEPLGFDDLAMLLFTSGTTGVPKGVQLTHGNLWWNSVNVDSVVDTRRTDVTLATAPLFHIGALNSFVLRALVRGGSIVIRRGFDPQQMADDLADLRISTFFAVPAMMAALARVPGFLDRGLPHLRGAVVAGAPVPRALIELYHRHGIVLEQAWGLTETAPFATHLPREQAISKVGSAGVAMPHTEVAIVDAATGERITEPGLRGEIVVRGPNVTIGYWNDEPATARAFDDDGYFHSGDIGYLDDDGYLFIVDRLKDMIISGGENVYPAEVENALGGLPGVLDVAVVGRPDDKWGETVVAIVAVAAGTSLSLEQVRAYAEQHLARYKLPRDLLVVEAVPRNAAGKINKPLLRQLVLAGKQDNR